MKQILRKFGAILLTLVMLGSTTSWMVSKHYCLGHLVEVSFFDSPEGCGMDMEGSEEMTCCTDEIIVQDGQDQLQLKYESFEFSNLQYFFTPQILCLILIEDIPDTEATKYIHPPPKLVRDIQLLDEVFLI